MLETDCGNINEEDFCMKYIFGRVTTQYHKCFYYFCYDDPILDREGKIKETLTH